MWPINWVTIYFIIQTKILLRVKVLLFTPGLAYRQTGQIKQGKYSTYEEGPVASFSSPAFLTLDSLVLCF